MVDGFDNCVVCAGFSLGGLAIVCFEEIAGVLVDAWVTELELSEAADVIICLKERTWLWTVKSRYSHGVKLECIAEDGSSD